MLVVLFVVCGSYRILVVVLLVVLGCFRCGFCSYLVVLFVVDFGCVGASCLVCSFPFMFGLVVPIVLCNCAGCGSVAVCGGCWWWLFWLSGWFGFVIVFDCVCGLG